MKGKKIAFCSVILALVIMGLPLMAGVQEKKNAARDDSQEPERISVTKAKLVKRVDPVYPPAALRDKIQGMVIVEAVASEEGEVVKATVVKSAHQLLDEAAVHAIRQWRYAPYLINGVAKKVKFTVTVNFTLQSGGARDKGEGRPESEVASCAKLVKKVDPVYPEPVKKEKIEGTVMVSLQVDEKGQVIEAKVIQALHPLLDEAAIQAARQWQYQPCIGPDGKAKPFSCTVTFSFVLGEKQGKSADATL